MTATAPSGEMPGGAGPPATAPCGAVAGGTPSAGTTIERAVEALRGLAYGSRLHIVSLLREGEMTPTALSEAIGAHQSAVAHHLRNLVDAGLLRRRRQGRRLFYSLADEATARLVDEVLRFARAR